MKKSLSLAKAVILFGKLCDQRD